MFLIPDLGLTSRGPDYHWVIGVALAALASFISNLGINVQKYAHVKQQHADRARLVNGLGERRDENDDSEGVVSQEPYYKDPLWVLGLFLVILGSLADFAALAFGAQSIIAPLGALGLMSNVCFAHLLLGEHITKRDIWATACIVVGATMSVIFASHQDTIYSLEELFSFYGKPRFLLLSLVTLITVLAMYSFHLSFDKLKHETNSGEPYKRVEKYHRFIFAALSGTIGAQNVLFAKCTVELLANTIAGRGSLFLHYETYFVLCGLGSTIFLQLKFLNEGLRQFEACYIVPVFQTFWIVVSVVSGLLFFGEYENFDETQAVAFPIGVSVTLIGVAILSRRKVNSSLLLSDARDITELTMLAEVPSPLDGIDHENEPHQGEPRIGTRTTLMNVAKKLALVDPHLPLTEL